MWKGSHPASATVRSPGVFRIIGRYVQRLVISEIVSPFGIARGIARPGVFQFDSGRSSHVGSGACAAATVLKRSVTARALVIS